MPVAKNSGKGIRFLFSAISSATDECIMWPYFKMKNGYGQVGTSEGMSLAHRYVCIEVNGEPPFEKAQAAHLCGNRACVNPKHIRWATQSENENDKWGHGTWLSRISTPKWTEQDVADVRRRYECGDSVQKIAAETGIPKSTVLKIARRTTWRHLP